MKFLMIVAACVAGSYAMINCNVKDICSQVRCDLTLTAESCSGRFVENGGFCGCCHNCVRQIAEGENCIESTLIGAPPRAECGGETFCHPDTVLCTRKTCAMKLAEMTELLEGERPILGAEKPVCTDDGDYHPKQCRGSQCFCVSKTGDAIEDFAANRWEAADMNCQCARDRHEYRQTGMIGKMFRCEDNGNYKKLQCLGSVCYCVDELGAKKEELGAVHISQSHKLEC